MPIFGGIFVGRRFGAFDSTPAGGRVDDAVGPSFPPAGSYSSTLYGTEYPIAQGGTYFTNPVTSLSVPNQVCDVIELHDGSGGVYIDWSSVTNIQYKANGDAFYTDPTSQPLDIEVPSGSGNYYQGGTYNNEFYHDGAGWWFSGGINTSYYSNGTDTNIGSLSDGNQQTEVPYGSGNYYDNGLFNGYTWDGAGGYNYPVTKGNYYSNGSDTNIEVVNGGDQQTEVPSGSGNYYSNGLFNGYTWDGSGGYNFPVTKGAYYSNGTDTNLTGLDVLSETEVPSGSAIYWQNGQNVGYTWDGSGGYNYPVTKAAYYSNGTDTNLTGLDAFQQTEVPSGSGNYYNNGQLDGYTWDGNGGYNYPVTKGAYYSSGSVIFHYDNTVEVPSGSGQNFSNGTFQEYQWDGSGGYNDTSGGSYYSYGTYIYNDGSFDYYWDGNGGYYS